MNGPLHDGRLEMSNNLSDLLVFIYIKIKCTITYIIEMVF
jgi:hypothetical protein